MIKSIVAHKSLNSRASWTVRTRVELDDGTVATQTVPEGASTGEREAVSLPVEEAVINVNSKIAPALIGMDHFKQLNIDSSLIDLDGSENKSNIGANAILSVSLAIAKAASYSLKIPLYEYLSDLYFPDMETVFPTPTLNILNGGLHARNNLSFQEFMVIPALEFDYERKLEIGVDCYNSLSRRLIKEGHSVGVGDEGGFAPAGFNTRKALEYIVDSVGDAGYIMGEEVFLGLDVAAGSFYDETNEKYEIKEEELSLSTKEMISYYKKLLLEFPIIYLEDPLDENSVGDWAKYFGTLSKNTIVVGDDLVVTNPLILEEALDPRAISGVIVKPNQIGTLSETMEFVRKAQENKLVIIVSHRSGETPEDKFVSDLALAVCAEFVKFGAPARGERVVKYNRLLEILHHHK